MSKSLIAAFLFILSLSVKSQNPEVITITSNDRMMTGYIDDKYPITVYLQVANRSDNAGYVFSLRGWYMYDNVGTRIPLAGIDGQGIHLFTSADQKVLKSLENFEYGTADGTEYLDSHLFEIEERVTKVSGITERFQLTYQDNNYKGIWYSNGKELPVDLNTRNHLIQTTKNYLKLPDGTYFDLENIEVPIRTSFEIEGTANGGRNILMHYTYHANLNYMGRCGGAVNSGKISLEFDENYSLINMVFAQFEDCYQDIYVDDLNKVSETVSTYKIYGSGNDPIEYVVDYKSAKITKK